MPLPLLVIIAAVTGAAGLGLGINGGAKMKKAKDKLSDAQKRDSFNRTCTGRINRKACEAMDALGNNEMKALAGFDSFSELFEQIKNKPEFEDIRIGEVRVPKFDAEELKTASVGAGVLISGLGGAVLGTAGGFAASGATTAAVMALGTASTGTAISTLSGAAATNATLAALGGGSIAAGGGGVALGTTVLGAATLGVALLVGGIVFNVTGSVLSNKADQAWDDMLKNEKEMKRICAYLVDLEKVAIRYNKLLVKMMNLYDLQLEKMRKIIKSHESGNVEWSALSTEEKLIIENMVIIVSVLFNMCAVQLVKKSDGSNLNEINHEEIEKAEREATETINNIGKTV